MKLALLFAACATVPLVTAGPIAYAICQAGCYTASGTCYTAAGFIFGIFAPAAMLACNTALGTCSTACIAAFIAPTP